MRGHSFNHRNLRLSVGSLTLWSIVAAGVLVLVACHRAGPNTPTASNGRPIKAPDSVQSRERCAIDSIPPDEAGRIQTRIEEFQVNDEIVKPNTAVRRIKVFFHVIKGEQPTNDGNLDQTQIDTQMNVLNDMYASAHFQFELSKVDWRTNLQWFEMEKNSPAESAAMQALGNKRKDVLDIYTANIGAYGWAVYPQQVSANPYRDGVVIHFSTLPGGAVAHYNQGKTLGHEVGHWLGLFHTSHGGCTAPGDYIKDTPAENVDSRECVWRDTCPADPGLDPIDNFMDYSPDACTSKFTNDQSVRMHQMFAAYRQGP
jgi:hypothetical protein